ncbi:MAG TPA: hypothetical protein VMZ22_08980 [Acidimicrobiales bacterium]|nr:hypothetical protein [Acidimicrobiales bacterium]
MHASAAVQLTLRKYAASELGLGVDWMTQTDAARAPLAPWATISAAAAIVEQRVASRPRLE